MAPNEDIELTDEQYRELLQIDLSSFVERSFTELNPRIEFIGSRYIDLICSRLEDCRTGKIKRLIINLPPRSLKSHTVSVAFVAYLLGHDPTKQIICASYGQDLADKHALDCRTLMSTFFYRNVFPQTMLGSKQSVAEFMTSKQGFRLSTSVGGVLTGRGGDFIILDDAMKPEEALSDTRRKAVNDWYQNTLLSRLNSKSNGVIIIVMQRLHEDDLVGHVLEQEDHWEVLRLPAIAEEDESYSYQSIFGEEVFSRKRGEVLHPERDSLETMRDVRAEIGEYNFESQYQQSPKPLDGGVIKKSWIKYFELKDAPPKFDLKIQSWDTANKVGELNDYSVCTTWGMYDNSIYMLDLFRMRLNYPDLKRAVRQQYEKHRPTKILIEDKSSGISLIQELKGESVHGIEAYKIASGSDKGFRLHAVSTKFESGRVFVPFGAVWLPDYIAELTGFPGTKFDDQVDSTTQALDYLENEGQKITIWVRLGRAR